MLVTCKSQPSVFIQHARVEDQQRDSVKNTPILLVNNLMLHKLTVYIRVDHSFLLNVSGHTSWQITVCLCFVILTNSKPSSSARIIPKYIACFSKIVLCWLINWNTNLRFTVIFLDNLIVIPVLIWCFCYYYLTYGRTYTQLMEELTLNLWKN